ncbi:succinate dehydrogenase assembly factor 2 [Pontibaca salina]|uniref:FAD assembly factor SdhE n=1 Tax=Pontibaca salina TaxID=2795731 RepID=A0A934HIP8_9RHOB|nr:succinate dehydrogenase assembly factor 2 [Pontibaca salina]MBI6628893.1 succinate dehydrogenase assembly factor 2 [Pontibaca salina]
MTSPAEARLKRLKMRSMRRGIREMDLILTAYADHNLAKMTDSALNDYEALLHENDHDLYQWVTGQTDAPKRYQSMIKEISGVFQG